MVKWRCVVCGYVHDGDEPPEKCPKCGVPASKFVRLQEKKPVETKTDGPVTEWKCSNCGYALKASVPPGTCPSCQHKCEFIDVTCYIPECQFTGRNPNM